MGREVSWYFIFFVPFFVTVNKGLSSFLTDGFCIVCSAGHSQGRAARSRAVTPTLCRHP